MILNSVTVNFNSKSTRDFSVSRLNIMLIISFIKLDINKFLPITPSRAMQETLQMILGMQNVFINVIASEISMQNVLGNVTACNINILNMFSNVMLNGTKNVTSQDLKVCRNLNSNIPIDVLVLLSMEYLHFKEWAWCCCSVSEQVSVGWKFPNY